jgi:23S rRNA U2552 (ribose-2'-O)-methylase RlmE/FtsJ
MSRSILSIPKLISFNKEIYDYREPSIVVFPIILDTYESHSKNISKIIEKKIFKLEGKCTKYGYILKIVSIIKYTKGIIEKSSFDCSVSYSVWIRCHIVKPEYGSIITGNKITKIRDTGDTFLINLNTKEEYSYFNNEKNKEIIKNKYNTRILVPGATIKDKNKYSENDIVSIHCIHGQYNLSESVIFMSGIILNIYNIHFKNRYVAFKNLDNKVNDIMKISLSYSKDGSKIHASHDENKINLSRSLRNVIKEINFLGSKWDSSLRLLLNPYELIKTRKFHYKNYEKYFLEYKFKIYEEPVSRAYFKSIEIYSLFIKKYNNSISEDEIFVTLGDAPGGFAQALSHMCPKNKIITTSLNLGTDEKNNENNIPIYKNSIKNNKNILIDYMYNKDGDITNYKNIESFFKNMLTKYKRKAYIVGGDAAIDSSIYESSLKENIQLQLLIAEIIMGTILQSDNGCAFYKAFTQYNSSTVKVFYWISQYYKYFYIYKPMSSRIANMETFIICIGFKGISLNKINELIKLLIEIKPQLKYEKLIGKIFDGEVPYDFENRVMLLNKHLLDSRKFIYEQALDIIINTNKGMNFNKNLYIKDQEVFIKEFINIINSTW